MGLAKDLATEMNQFDLSSEKSKDDDVYYEGKRRYHNIKIHMKLIKSEYLKTVPSYLNENGQKVYERYYKKMLEEQIKENKGKD